MEQTNAWTCCKTNISHTLFSACDVSSTLADLTQMLGMIWHVLFCHYVKKYVNISNCGLKEIMHVEQAIRPITYSTGRFGNKCKHLLGTYGLLRPLRRYRYTKVYLYADNYMARTGYRPKRDMIFFCYCFCESINCNYGNI